MQTILNKAVRFIHCNEDEQLNTEQLHHKYNITPLNISNYNRALKTWETISTSEFEKYEELTLNRDKSHKWFPKCSNIVNMATPQAIITNFHL